MSPLAIASIVFACILIGTVVGMALSFALPKHHLSKESQDVVKLGIGMVATMTALILGLVTASAKSSFDTQDTAVKHIAGSILTFDRMLARYGPETKEAREMLRRLVTSRFAAIWPEDSSQFAKMEDAPKTTLVADDLLVQILDLSPKTDAQRWFQSQALAIATEVLQTRWLVLGGKGSSVQLPFLVVMVFWLTVIFGSFGLYAPRNTTVIVVLVVCALSVAASVFLILEMDHPFDGMMKISSAPMRFTLSHLGQ